MKYDLTRKQWNLIWWNQYSDQPKYDEVLTVKQRNDYWKKTFRNQFNIDYIESEDHPPSIKLTDYPGFWGRLIGDENHITIFILAEL